MHDIFLSYSKKDKSIAKEIALGLESEGFKVWWDANIPTGHTWDSTIENAIENCNCVLVLWSETSIDSEWVRIEAAEGKKKNILIPVRIADVEPPLAFRRRQYIDLIGWQKNTSDSRFRKLVDDIKELIQNENYTVVDNPKLQPKAGSQIVKKRFNYLWLLALISAIALSTFGIIRFFDTPNSNLEALQIKPIVFNVKKDSLMLIFRSQTLKRRDTFAIEHNASINFLKESIERHYNFTIPSEFAVKITNGATVKSYLVADHNLLRDESVSLKNAGLEDFDIIEFDYKLIID